MALEMKKMEIKMKQIYYFCFIHFRFDTHGYNYASNFSLWYGYQINFAVSKNDSDDIMV